MYSREIKMAHGTGCYVVRESDAAIIPADPANADWQAYQAWLTTETPPIDPAGSASPEVTPATTA